MDEDIVEFACGVSLLAIVAFALTPAFWQLIVFLGR